MINVFFINVYVYMFYVYMLQGNRRYGEEHIRCISHIIHQHKHNIFNYFIRIKWISLPQQPGIRHLPNTRTSVTTLKSNLSFLFHNKMLWKSVSIFSSVWIFFFYFISICIWVYVHNQTYPLLICTWNKMTKWSLKYKHDYKSIGVRILFKRCKLIMYP